MFTTPLWLSDPSFAAIDVTRITADVTALLDRFGAAVERRQVGRATNFLTLALKLNEERSVAYLQRAGLCRPSRYVFDSTVLKRAVNISLDNGDTIGLTATGRAYLGTVNALSDIAAEIAPIRQQLRRFLRAERYLALKSFLAIGELLFLDEYLGDRSLSPADIRFYSKEEIAEALSLVAHEYAVLPLSPRDLSFVDASAIQGGRYVGFLRDACLIRVFRNWEILVDVLGYRTTGDNSIALQPTDRLLAQSCQFGFIQTAADLETRYTKYLRPQVDSLDALASEVLRRLEPSLVQRHYDPVEYFAYSIPKEPQFQAHLADSSRFFREELVLLDTLSEQYLLPVDELLDLIVCPNVTVRDLMMAHRIVRFFSALTRAHLRPRIATQLPAVLHSLLPQFTDEQIHELFSMTVEPRAIPPLLSLLGWSGERGVVFDIQYRPLLRLGGRWTLPVHICSSSNVVRNSLRLARGGALTKTDRVSTALERVLSQQGWGTRTRLTYEFESVRGEIDVATMRERYLFVFECKQSIDPAILHEVRTSYDHVIRAGEQLDRIVSLWQRPGFRPYLAERLRWALAADAKLVTCIVTANRFFSGYRVRGHAVRSSHEILGFVQQGVIGVSGKSRTLWEREGLDEQDLRRFIEEDLVHGPLFRAMVRRDETFHIGRFTVTQESYAIDLTLAATELAVFPPVDASQGAGK